MKHNKQQSHYVLDFSDIEDISDNESESSKSSNKQQQINQSTPTPNRIEIQIPNLQVKKETVEIPSILIQEEEEPVMRRKLDAQKQQWQVNFDELSEQEQQDSDRSQVAIEIPRDPSPPTIVVEEPQYIEQYFEDQNVIEEIDIEQEQLKLEQRKDQLKQDMINKKQQQKKEIPKVQQIQKEQQKVQEVNQLKNKNFEDKIKYIHKQKYFYNPKNSLIYLRLKGREDLYKKQEYIIDEQTKPPDQDELLEGLECINNLLIGLSKIKDKKVGAIEKQQKMLPLQIHKHRLDEKGDHHKESKLQKKNEKEKDIEQQQQQQKNLKDVQKDKDLKENELIIKQQQLQEAQLARQIRHEKQQQEKEKQKLLEQRQLYKILTKKQVNLGLILYKCQLRQKQKDSIKWLRYSEIALISKGESEIFNFEKRISDQLFMQLHKTNMRSVLITKQAMFDIVTIHYVKEQKEVEEIKQKDKAQLTKNEKDNSIVEEKQIKVKQVIQNNDKKRKNQDQQRNEVQQKVDKQQQKDKLQQDIIQQQQTQLLQQDIQQDQYQQQQQEIKRIKNKVSYIESDEEKKDEDLLDADSIQIFKITQDRQRKLDKKEKEQKQLNNIQQQVEESKQIELNELNQKQNNNNNSQIKEQKKVKNLKIKECPLSRLETNDEIKKKEQINQKRKEKRKQEYQQYLNEIEQEQLIEVTLSKQKKHSKDSKIQETNQQIIKSNDNKETNQQIIKSDDNKEKNQQIIKSNDKKGQKRNNQKETQNLVDQTNEKDKEETKNSNSTKRNGKQNTRSNKSPSPQNESIEPGYVSSKRIYQNRDQKKKKLRVIEDDESEFNEQNVKQDEQKVQKKRVRQK